MLSALGIRRFENREFPFIIFLVIAIHLLIIFLLLFSFKNTPMNPIRSKHVVVKTVQLKAFEQTKHNKKDAADKELAILSTEIKKKVQPSQSVLNTSRSQSKQQVKKEAKAETKKTVPPKQKNQEKLAASSESISKIQQQLSKIETKSLKNIPTVEIPNPLANMAIETMNGIDSTSSSSKEAYYRDRLANRLKMSLTLPEHGEVVIHLTLNRSGTVLRLQIVSSVNPSNRSYIERTIPSMVFSDFGNDFKGESQHTFIVALRSESL